MKPLLLALSACFLAGPAFCSLVIKWWESLPVTGVPPAP